MFTIGKTIAELRKKQDLTQVELAERVGVSQSYLARWERGHAQPRPKALEKLAEALNVTVEELVTGGSAQLEVALGVSDGELVSLLQELQRLNESELEALKTVIRGLLARSRMEEVFTR